MVDEFIDLKDKGRVVLSDSDMALITNNPAGLTLEGAKVSANDWMTNSRNRYLQAVYSTMVQKCKALTQSGKLDDGKTILSRDKENKVTWAEWLDVDFNRYSRRQWEALPEEKRH